MKKQKYQSLLIDGQQSAKNWMILSFILVISNILLVYKIVTISVDQKTVIHPVSLHAPYAIDSKTAEPEYVKALAEQFLFARFQYTPETVKAQFDSVLEYFHPSVFGKKQASLGRESGAIVRDDLTSAFHPMQSHVKQNKVYIEGRITQFLGDKKVGDRVRTLEVEFRNSGGRLWLVDWFDVRYDRVNKVYTRTAVEGE